MKTKIILLSIIVLFSFIGFQKVQAVNKFTWNIESIKNEMLCESRIYRTIKSYTLLNEENILLIKLGIKDYCMKTYLTE